MQLIKEICQQSIFQMNIKQNLSWQFSYKPNIQTADTYNNNDNNDDDDNDNDNNDVNNNNNTNFIALNKPHLLA